MVTDPRSRPPEPAEDALPSSRRHFLIGAGAVAGAGALAAASAGPAQAASGAPGASATTGDPDASGEPIVAFVRNVAAGEISVMRGDREVLVRDRSLARALARKAG